MWNKKKIIIPVAILLCVALIMGGIFAVLRLRRKPVNVYTVSDFSMHDSYIGNNYSSGTVYTDRLQTVFLSETQQVTEVLVKEGQTVKAGDPLLNFDTTLTNLQIQQKDLEIQRLERDLHKAKQDYNELVGHKYYAVSATGQYTPVVSLLSAEAERATIKLLTEVDPSTPDPTDPPVDPENPDPSEPDPGGPDDPDPPNTLPGEAPVDGVVGTYYCVGGSGSSGNPYLYVFTDGIPFDDEFITALMADNSEIYVVFAQTEDNRVDGIVTGAWGICFTSSGSGYKFSLFDATGKVGNTLQSGSPSKPDDPPYIPDNPDVPSGPTAAELEEMKMEKQQEIRDLDLQIRMTRLEYRKMQEEMGDGTIYADIDGNVSLVGDPETAFKNNEPVLKVSGGGGYYVEGTVSELKLDTIKIGQQVTVNSWYSGDTCEGTIDSISTYPSEGGNYSSDSNPNVTFYAFTVFIDENENLQANEGVEISFHADDESENSLYLEQAFILQESGKSYVYVRGEDGRLEKREVATGRDLWGNYLEIKSGLTQEDQIAFPYEKNVSDGAKTREATSDELYAH